MNGAALGQLRFFISPASLDLYISSSKQIPQVECLQGFLLYSKHFHRFNFHHAISAG